MPNKLVVIGCSCGGLEAIDYLLPKMELGENSLLISPHISSNSIYKYIRSKNKILLQGQEETIMPGFTYVIDYGAFDKLSLLKQRMLFDDPNYKIEIKYKIKFYLNNKLINGVMEAAANGYGDKCIGIILSGAGDDGSLGLKCIKDRKGIAMVQIEKDPSYYDQYSYRDEMPFSALEKTGVDFQGPLPDLVKELNRYLL